MENGTHCYWGHEEIVFFGEECPLCKIREISEQINTLESIVDDLLENTKLNLKEVRV